MFDKENIDIELLKYAINEILDHVIKTQGKHIQLEHDLYWEIIEEQIYNIDHSPSEINISQLYDDWEFANSLIKDMRNDGDKALREPIMLMHLWPLLRYIYHKHVLSLK